MVSPTLHLAAGLLLALAAPLACAKSNNIDLSQMGDLLNQLGKNGGEGDDGEPIDLMGLLGGLQGGGKAGKDGKKKGGCPDGEVWMPKIDYRSSANGCGPQGMRQRNGDKWDFHMCCNGHDTCYAACGISFSYCEKAFKKCLAKKCEGVDEADAKDCKQTASSFASMTQMFGSGFFESGIAEACECKPADQKKEHLKDFLTQFYTRYNVAADGENADLEGTEKKIAAIDGVLEKYEGNEGYLLWKLNELYPNYVDWVTEGKDGLSEEECKITVTKAGKRSD
eukprot:SAG22_NODE_696_length_7828_cov_35.057964_4_plen_281_part_00